MSDQEIATQNAPAENTESAPVNNLDVNEVSAENTESAPVEEQSEVAEETPEAKPSKAVQELIDQRKKRQKAERDAEYWRGVAEGRGGKPHEPQPQVVQPQAPPSAPKLDDFETYEEYETAKEEYLISQAEFRIAQKFRAQHQQQQAQTVQQQFKARLAEAAEKDPLIEDIANDPTLPVSAAMAPIIQLSDKSPELLKWLHNNRKEAARIAALPPLMAAKELGIVEAKLSLTPKPTPPKKVSTAPEPIPTVTPAGSVAIDEDDLPIDEYIRRRNKVQFGR